jgi:MoxR-like ATPase
MQDAATTTDARDALARVERELSADVLEREEVVRSMILAPIAGEHVLLLGPPGTAKSRLARSLCERISGASYFYACLNRSSLPD